MGEKKKKPKIKVLDWPAIPVPTPEEVYGITTEEKARIEKKLKSNLPRDGNGDSSRRKETE